MPHLKRVAFTLYPVTDMARARAFYEGVLGLLPGENFGGAFQEYDFGGTTLAIDSSPFPFLQPGTQASVSLETDDLDGFIQTIKSQGHSLVDLGGREKGESPVCYMAFVRDPDGNIVGLHQCK